MGWKAGWGGWGWALENRVGGRGALFGTGGLIIGIVHFCVSAHGDEIALQLCYNGYGFISIGGRHAPDMRRG